MKTFTEKDLQNMKKADLIALLQGQAQEVLQAVQKAQEVQAQADKAQAVMQEVTGLSPERIAYEEKKYIEGITCTAVIPAVFNQDTVLYRAQHDTFLKELGRRYVQEVLQADSKKAGKPAGRKARKADRPAGTGNAAGRQAQKKEDNNLYKYLCTKVKDLQETDKYSTIKKDGKTVARVYVMLDNKLKFLVKEETAKKAGLNYTMMKFNLPASIVAGKAQEVDALLKSF